MPSLSLQDILKSAFFSDEWKEFRDTTLHRDSPFDSRENFIRGIMDKDIPSVGRLAFPFQSVHHFEDILKRGGKGHYYFREGSPIEDELCRRLVQAEVSYIPNQHHLSGAIFSSGMAAISSIVHSFHNALYNTKMDDLHFIVDGHVYADTRLLFEEYVPTLGFGRSIFTDCSKQDHVQTILAYNPEKIVAIFYEPLRAPYLDEIKTTEMREVANWHGGIPLIVDTTLIPSNLQQQFRLGADVVVNSLAKYVSGNGDLSGGAIVAPQPVVNYVRRLQRVFGNLPSPDSMGIFCERLETLPERMDVHIENTNVFTDYLREHQAVEKVFYPLYNGVIAGASPGGVFSFRFAGKHAQEKVKRTERLMEFLIESDNAPIANQVGFGSNEHSMLIQTPYKRSQGDPGLVRFAVGREPSAKQVIPFLDKALDYACNK
jgi:cystathionine beta-lyase/cystathionine gamma-synthase